jgi:chorismate mutase
MATRKPPTKKDRPSGARREGAPRQRRAPRRRRRLRRRRTRGIRDSIDAIDARIHALLNERARFAQLVGISKSASGKAVDFYRPEREAEVLRKALEAQQGTAAR